MAKNNGYTSTFMLPKAIKHEWVKALRSGNYHQGHAVMMQHLEDDKGEYAAYCCLGVLCSILGVDDYSMNRTSFPTEVGIGETIDDDDLDEYGLDQGDVLNYDALTFAVRYNNKLTPLSELNDDETFGLTFPQIANVIERTVMTYE